MRKALAVVLFGLGVLATASAIAVEAPEIDAAGGANALALLAGTVLVFMGRRRK